MKRFKPWIVIALVFFAGLVVGVGGTRIMVRRVIERVMSDPAVVGEKVERDLARDLRLTADQRVKIHEIVNRGQDELKEIRRETRPRVTQVFQRGERDIRAILTEPQKVRFERRLQRRPFVPPVVGAADSPK